MTISIFPTAAPRTETLTAILIHSSPDGKSMWQRLSKTLFQFPLLPRNTIKNPDWAEELLEEGISDYVGLGRSQFADPEFVKKAKEGRADEIVKCIGCMYCRERLMADMPIECSINPRLGYEFLYKEPVEDGDGKSVVVVGGGPGGMEAAIVLAKRGFNVTLMRKERRTRRNA